MCVCVWVAGRGSDVSDGCGWAWDGCEYAICAVEDHVCVSACRTIAICEVEYALYVAGITIVKQRQVITGREVVCVGNVLLDGCAWDVCVGCHICVCVWFCRAANLDVNWILSRHRM